MDADSMFILRKVAIDMVLLGCGESSDVARTLFGKITRRVSSVIRQRSAFPRRFCFCGRRFSNPRLCFFLYCFWRVFFVEVEMMQFAFSFRRPTCKSVGRFVTVENVVVLDFFRCAHSFGIYYEIVRD